MSVDTVSTFDLVIAERRLQERRWTAEDDKRLTDNDWLARIAKQVGQVADALVGGARPERVRHHLVQIGALCAAWDQAGSGVNVAAWCAEIAPEVLDDLSHSGDEVAGEPLGELLWDIGWLADDIRDRSAGVLSNVATVAVRALAWAVRLGATEA
ncbi:MAG: hypothetical protein ACYCT1_08270 [Steroidobacteraceae bacterium]